MLFNVFLLPLLMAWVFTQAAGADEIDGVAGRLFVLTGVPGCCWCSRSSSTW